MRCSKLVMCALSSTQALDEALVRSVQCSKQARKALARGDVPVAWLDVTAADDAVAERLAPLLAGPARCAHDDDAFEAHTLTGVRFVVRQQRELPVRLGLRRLDGAGVYGAREGAGVDSTTGPRLGRAKPRLAARFWSRRSGRGNVR